MKPPPSVLLLDVNETLSDLTPLAGRFEGWEPVGQMDALLAG